MPFEKGHRLSVGHDGRNAGRKSAYEEFQAAKQLHEEWFEKDLAKVFYDTVRSPKKTKASERLLAEVFKKLVPDKVEHSGGFALSYLSDEELNNQLNAEEKALDGGKAEET